MASPREDRFSAGEPGRRAHSCAWVLLAVALAIAREPARGQGYPLFQIDGTAPYELLGTSIARIGDANGDGVPDLLVGAPGADPGGLADAGSARVYSGVDGALLASIDGLAPGDRAGMSVASAGLLDGDGVTEWIVGAPQDGNGGPGYARVVSGATGAVLFTFNGLLPGDRFGAAVAGAGLVNLGLTPDVIVGAPRPGSGAGPGYARVFSGSNGALLLALNGTSLGDSFGYAVAGVGTFNADFFGDVMVGAPTSPQGGFNGGMARIFSGQNGAVLRTVIGGPDEWAGLAVLGPGDLDQDGFRDYMVGLPRGSYVQSGYVAVLSGQSGTIMQAPDGAFPLDWLGCSLAMVGGDLGVDGFPDWIAGAPESPLAGDAGYVRVFPGILISETPLVTLFGSAPGDAFGWSVAGPGDLNGDFDPDIAVGAPGADPGGATLAGRVHLFSAVGVPPGSSLFGAGCSGPDGEAPRIAAIGGEPVVGAPASPAAQSLAVRVSRVPPGKAALLVAGFSDQAWGPSPLPLDLAFLGLPGCSLLTAPAIFEPRITAGFGPLDAAAAVPISLPASPALAGVHVYLQWYVSDPGPGFLPGSMSAGLDLLLL